MRYKITLLLLISVTTILTAQDKKFSFEVNYPLAISNGLDGYTGIVNGNFKYRFAQSENFRYGAGITFDFLKDNSTYGFRKADENYFFFHIGGFAEMTIPSLEKLHPYAGIGFTYLVYDDPIMIIQSYPYDTPSRDEKQKDPGFNFKIGLQYDISKSIFIQSYFHFIRTYLENAFNDESEGYNRNLLKFGIGFRF